MARNAYPIIGNCNFSTRDDATGKAVHAARGAVESGRADDAKLVAALDALEQTLAEYAERGDERATEYCRFAEEDVQDAWEAVRRVSEAHEAGYC